MKKLRKLLNVNGGQKVQIIAKIENGSGIDNLDSILEIADGVMIARGDMGVEVPFDHLPSIQKNNIKKCYKKERIVLKAKAIVVATVSGYTAHIASYYRPSVPIIASCTDEKATKQLKLDYSVYPYHVELTNDRDLTYSHGQAHGNLAMVTTAAPQRASYTVSGPRDPSGLAL